MELLDEQIIAYRARRWRRGGDGSRCLRGLPDHGPGKVCQGAPRQVCASEVVTHQAAVQDPKRVTGSIIGAVAGGLLGNQIGDGDGQTVATVAGAAAGGYAGNKVQKSMQEGNTTQTVEQRCRTVYDSAEKPDGYQVRYRLGDHEGSVRMDHDPGNSIPVENGELVLNDDTVRR